MSICRMPSPRKKPLLKRGKHLKQERKGRSYGGASAEQRAAERRTRLLDAGLNILGEGGYHAAKVRAIWAEAGRTQRHV